MYLFIKRTFDIIFALFLLVVLSPLLLIFAIMIKIDDPKSSIFFKQKRIGKNEQVFEVIKFRTMKSPDKNSDNRSRVTKIGAFLRKTSFDEIPQMLNVIKGDMSLIGPRPLLVEYLPYYYESERKRHYIRPGLSGLAQISGRNCLNWDQRFAIDVEYVEKMSLIFDIKIFAWTVAKILRRSDVAVASEELEFERLDVERKDDVQRPELLKRIQEGMY